MPRFAQRWLQVGRVTGKAACAENHTRRPLCGRGTACCRGELRIGVGRALEKQVEYHRARTGARGAIDQSRMIAPPVGRVLARAERPPARALARRIDSH